MSIEQHLGEGWEEQAGADEVCAAVAQPGLTDGNTVYFKDVGPEGEQHHSTELGTVVAEQVEDFGDDEEATLFRCSGCGKTWWEEGRKEQYEYITLQRNEVIYDPVSGQPLGVRSVTLRERIGG